MQTPLAPLPVPAPGSLRRPGTIAKIGLRAAPTPRMQPRGALLMASKAALKPIPDKLYFPIREVAELTGVETYVLRFWEKEFPMLQPVKESSGHRRYRRKDIELVLEIKRLLYDEGFTIPGARTVLQKGTPVPSLFALPPRDGQASGKKRGSRGPAPKSPEDVLRRVRAELGDILTLLK